MRRKTLARSPHPFLDRYTGSNSLVVRTGLSKRPATVELQCMRATMEQQRWNHRARYARAHRILCKHTKPCWSCVPATQIIASAGLFAGHRCSQTSLQQHALGSGCFMVLLASPAQLFVAKQGVPIRAMFTISNQKACGSYTLYRDPYCNDERTICDEALRRCLFGSDQTRNHTIRSKHAHACRSQILFS